MVVSVVCPVFNEAGYIQQIMDFFVKSLPAGKELLIIDGGSTDETMQMVLSMASVHPEIRFISNPSKFVPFALNLAIPQCKGDIIVRLDAHTKYADDYFLRIIDCFERTGTDIAGGPMRAVGNNNLQTAIALATSTLFGVGDSSFHDETHEGYVESVYLGAWKRRVFEVAGLFDTDMLRNQDDEFHYRAREKGLKIYLDPKIRSFYYPRSSFKSLFKQYYQYGLFKPLVLQKVKSGIRLRHLIPAGFVIYLASLPIAIVFYYWLIPLVLYLFINLLFSIKHGENGYVKMMMLLVYPALHISYGIGFINGQLSLFLGKKPVV